MDFSWAPGQIVELDSAEAAKWADGDRAEYADPPTPSAAKPTKVGGRGKAETTATASRAGTIHPAETTTAPGGTGPGGEAGAPDAGKA